MLCLTIKSIPQPWGNHNRAYSLESDFFYCGDFKKVMGCSIAFQASRNPRVSAEMILGTPSGIPMFQKRCQWLAPSIAADSNTSLGNQRCSQLTARRCDSDCSDFFFGFTLGGGSNALIMGQGDKNGAATWTFHTNRGILISNYLHSKLKYRRTAICMIIW